MLLGMYSRSPGSRIASEYAALANCGYAARSAASTRTGEVPKAPTGNLSAWATGAIEWPGGAHAARPTDGVTLKEVPVAVLLGLTYDDGEGERQRIEAAEGEWCAVQLASAHANARDGSIVPELATLSPRLRINLLPYDTHSKAEWGLAAFRSAEAAGASAIIGARYSSELEAGAFDVISCAGRTCVLHETRRRVDLSRTLENHAHAFDALFDRLLACCLRHRDFSVWVHVNYEKQAGRLYARLVQLGIPSLIITGGCGEDDKEYMLTDFDRASAGCTASATAPARQAAQGQGHGARPRARRKARGRRR